jgi:hypothetical protein
MSLSIDQFYTLCLFTEKFFIHNPEANAGEKTVAEILRELRKMRLVALIDQTKENDVWMITRQGKAERGRAQSDFRPGPIRD